MYYAFSDSLFAEADGNYMLVPEADQEPISVSPECVTDLSVIVRSGFYQPSRFFKFPNLKRLSIIGKHPEKNRVAFNYHGSPPSLNPAIEELRIVGVTIDTFYETRQLAAVRKLHLIGICCATTILPVVVSRLRQLRELSVEYCTTPSRPFLDVTKLAQLESLTFCPKDYNGRFVTENEFQLVGLHKLVNLKYLNVTLRGSYNYLNQITTLVQLQTLIIDSSTLVMLHEWFDALKNLETLCIRKQANCTCLPACTRRNSCNVVYVPNNICNLRRLRVLTLFGEWGVVVPDTIALVPTLQSLRIYCNIPVDLPDSLVSSHLELYMTQYDDRETKDCWKSTNREILKRIQKRQKCPVSLFTLALRWINSHRNLFVSSLNVPQELLERIKEL